MAKEEEGSGQHSEQRENENEQEQVDREIAERVLNMAKSGDPESQFLLGHMFRDGSGVERDRMEGASWWWRAAILGHAGAQCALGDMHCNGDGVPMNPDEAMHWFELAAKQGDVFSQQSVVALQEYKAKSGRVKKLRLSARERQDLIRRGRYKLRNRNLTAGDYATSCRNILNLVAIGRRRARRGEEDLLSELEPEGEA